VALPRIIVSIHLSRGVIGSGQAYQR
jgi:hypothetical protein